MFEHNENVEARCPKARKWVKGTVVGVIADVTGKEDHNYIIAKASGIEFTVPASKVRELPGKTKEKKAAKTVKTIDEASVNSLSGQLHDDFQYAFNWFNERLFDGKLNKPFWVTVRKRNVLAHYASKRWASQDKAKNGSNTPTIVDEISINPDYMLLRGVEDFLSSIVHEMTHQWQDYFGEEKSRKNYHNKEWGDRMEAMGLIPSSTGAEGGKKTGQQMDHYIVDGTFRTACKELLDSGYAVRWAGAIEEFHGAGAAYIV